MKLVTLLLCLILGLAGCTVPVENSDMDPSDYINKAGWSATGTLMPGTTDESEGVGLQVQFADNPGAYTIQFNITQPNTLLQVDEFIRVRALVVWSVEGNSVRRIIDVVNGTSISGTAQAVDVSVYDDSNIVSTDVVPYTVSVQTAPGTRPSVQQPPNYTIGSISMTDTDNQSFDVPIEVGAISASVTVSPNNVGEPVAENEIIVFQVSESGAILKAYDPRVSQWVPLASGCRRLDIVTNIAAAPGGVLVQATLGVDG